jgi:hypothetical protein
MDDARSLNQSCVNLDRRPFPSHFLSPSPVSSYAIRKNEKVYSSLNWNDIELYFDFVLTLTVPARARGRLCFHKRAQTNRQTENRATPPSAGVVDICTPPNSRPVEGSIAVLDQRCWEGAICPVEAVHRRQRSGWRNFEDRPTATGEGGAIPAPARCPVQVSIAGLDQCCAGIGAVGVVEDVERGQRACKSDFEDRATGASRAVTVASPARVGHPVEIPIGGLDEPSGVTAVLQVKAVQRGQRTGCRDFEDRPAATGITTGRVPARSRCSIQVPVVALDQRSSGLLAVRATALGTKVVQRRQGAPGRDFEERPTAKVRAPIKAGVGSALLSRPVEVPVTGLDERGTWVSAARESAKIVQRRERATWSDFEDPAIADGPARKARPVEVPVGPQDQPRCECATRVQTSERAAWGDFEDHPILFTGVPIRCPVQVPVGAFDQARSGRTAQAELVQAGECLRR